MVLEDNVCEKMTKSFDHWIAMCSLYLSPITILSLTQTVLLTWTGVGAIGCVGVNMTGLSINLAPLLHVHPLLLTTPLLFHQESADLILP